MKIICFLIDMSFHWYYDATAPHWLHRFCVHATNTNYVYFLDDYYMMTSFIVLIILSFDIYMYVYDPR